MYNMITEQDYMNQIESDVMSGKLTLDELSRVIDGGGNLSRVGGKILDWIQRGSVSLDKVKSLVVQLEECSTSNLVNQWGQ